MATIDPATFLLLDEELGGIAPGRRATLNVLPEIGEWRPERVFVDGREVARDGRLIVPDAGDRLARRPEARRAAAGRVRAAHRDPARRALRERRDQPAPGQGRARDAGRARRPRRLVDHEGRRREPPARAWPGFATTATTSLELLVLGTDPDAMARAAAKVAEMGGGFAFDGGWSAPLEIDGLIAAGGYDRALRIERELTAADARRRLPVPRSALQPPVRVGRLPARAAADADRGAGGEVAHRCTIAHAWRRCSSGVSPSPCRSASARRSRTPLPASPSTPSRSALPRMLIAPSRPRTPPSSHGGRRAPRGAASSSTAARGWSHDHIGDLARLLTDEQGKPLRESRLEIHRFVLTLEHYAGMAKNLRGAYVPNLDKDTYGLVTKRPLGVVGAIVPWNFPTTLLVEQARARAGRRQHDGGQAGRHDAADDAADRRAAARGRAARAASSTSSPARARSSARRWSSTRSCARSASPARRRSASA